MTVNNPPSYLQNDGPNAEQHRQHMTAAYGKRPGVIGPDDLLVSQKSGTPNMSVDVADGRVLVAGGESTYQGLYMCHNRGVQNVAIATADPTNPRIDLVVARVQDSSESGATDSWDIYVVQGTPAASPSANTGAIPANAHVLASVAVAALASSIIDANITDLRKLDTYGNNDNGTAALPGTINCLSTDRPLSQLYEGMKIYETDTDQEWVYNGSTWIPGIKYGTTLTYTPTFVQGVAISKTVNHATYTKIGKRCHGNVQMTATSAGTPGANIDLGLPVPAAMTGVVIGQGYAFDQSAALLYSFHMYAQTASAGVCIRTVNGGAVTFLGPSGITQIAASDSVNFCFDYPTAS